MLLRIVSLVTGGVPAVLRLLAMPAALTYGAYVGRATGDRSLLHIAPWISGGYALAADAQMRLHQGVAVGQLLLRAVTG